MSRRHTVRDITANGSAEMCELFLDIPAPLCTCTDHLHLLAQAPLKVNGHYFTCSITVLEQKGGPQFILGLDMLRRHQCCIDLNRGVRGDGGWQEIEECHIC